MVKYPENCLQTFSSRLGRSCAQLRFPYRACPAVPLRHNSFPSLPGRCKGTSEDIGGYFLFRYRSGSECIPAHTGYDYPSKLQIFPLHAVLQDFLRQF